MLTWTGSKGVWTAEHDNLQFMIYSYDSLPFNTYIVWVLEGKNTATGASFYRSYRQLSVCKAQATRIAKRGSINIYGDTQIAERGL